MGKTWVTWAERIVDWLQRFLLQVDISEIVVHEADEPNAFVDFFDSEALTGKNGRDVDALAIHADAAAGGDEEVAVQERLDRRA